MDFNPSLFFGTQKIFKSVMAIQLAALVLISSIITLQGNKVGGLFLSSNEHKKFRPLSSKQGIIHILQALSNFSLTSIPNLQSISLTFALMNLQSLAKPGSLIIMISDFYQLDEEAKKQIAYLAIKNDVVAYCIADPLELSVPKAGCYRITNGHNSFVLDTSKSLVKKAYQQYLNKKWNDLDIFFKQQAIFYSKVATTDTLLTVISQSQWIK